MAGLVGFEPTLYGIKTRGSYYQDYHNPLKQRLSLSHLLCVISKTKKTVVKTVVNLDKKSLKIYV